MYMKNVPEKSEDRSTSHTEREKNKKITEALKFTFITTPKSPVFIMLWIMPAALIDTACDAASIRIIKGAASDAMMALMSSQNS